MQFSDTHLNFLRAKIDDIKVALFKSELNSEQCLPNNVIRVLKTDDEGNVYFFTSCNFTAGFDQPLYVYLDFHKRRSDVRLQVSGRAVVVEEEEGGDFIPGSPVLIKMKMMQAEYFDPAGSYHSSWAQRVKAAFNHIFLPASAQTLRFG